MVHGSCHDLWGRENVDLGQRPNQHHRLPLRLDQFHHPADMAQDRARTQAAQHVAEAEKRLKAWAFFDRTAKYEDASESYKLAGNQYKVAQEWKLAADCYVRSAEIARDHLERQDHHIADCYVQAAKSLKNISMEESLVMYKRAIELEISQNKFSTAGRHCREVAEMQERFEDWDDAIRYHQQAADCFKAADAISTALGSLSKVAHLTASRRQDYEKAINLFEAAATQALQSKNLQMLCKDYLYKSTLCQMIVGAKAGNMEKALEAMERYCNMYPALENTSELKFCRDLAEAFVNKKLDDFNEVLQKRNQIYNLDPFTVDLLLPIKEILKDGGEGEGAQPDIAVVGEGIEAEPDLS